MEISEKEIKSLLEDAYKSGWASCPEFSEEYANQVVESLLKSKKNSNSSVFSTTYSDITLSTSYSCGLGVSNILTISNGN